MQIASGRRRLLARLIDFLVCSAFIVLMGYFHVGDEFIEVMKNFIADVKLGGVYLNLVFDLFCKLSTMNNLIFFGSITLFYALYHCVLPIITNGRTLGKWIFRIRITKLNETKMSFGTLLIRDLLINYFINIMTLGIITIINLFFVFLNRGHRTLADTAANTVVMKTQYSFKRKR